MMELTKCKTALIFCLVGLSIVVCVKASVTSVQQKNQVWWTKNTQVVQKGCAGQCCSGKNSSCYSVGPKMAKNGVLSSQNIQYGTCYCDASCLDLGDCCEDYSVECQAVDCEVGEWGDYSECSKPCGLGAKTRHRQVIQEPRNGGSKCPKLKENTFCTGTKCKSQRHLGARGRVDLETARIMPAAYGQYRGYTKYNANMDIRKNLYDKYYAPGKVERKGYCATYKITSSRLSCSRNNVDWATVLHKGTEICVECHPKAMGNGKNSCMGHGSTSKDTFWTAVNAHGCHGWWRRMNELQECSCHNRGQLGFIFI